jgi:hypothetical protein
MLGIFMELTHALKRINQAVHAVELRQKTAVTCIRTQEACQLYFRGSIFKVSSSLCDEIPKEVEEIVPIKDGFVALAKDPDNLETFLWENAEKVIPVQEDWQNWAQGVGAGNLSYYDAMQAVALYALSPVHAE